MKGTMKVVLGMAAVVAMAAGIASAQTVAPTQQQAVAAPMPSVSIPQSAMSTVDEALLKMQQEMIAKNYAAMILKNQMRSKMMAERAPNNFMQATLQPIMMQKMRDQIKPIQMQRMQQN